MIDPDAHRDGNTLLLNPYSLVDRERLISDEIIRILGQYQGVEIAIPGRDAGETGVVTVHIPYMMQTLAIINDPTAFKKLPQRHQDRLTRVGANRVNAPEAVKQFLHKRFYHGTTNGSLLEVERVLTTSGDCCKRRSVKDLFLLNAWMVTRCAPG